MEVGGLALSFGVLFTVFGLSVVQAAAAQAMTDIDAGEPATALGSYRKVVPRLPTLLGGVLLAAVAVAVLQLTVVGIPVAVWLIVRWSLLAQVVQLDGRSAFGSLLGSQALVRRRWWRVASFTVVVTGLGLLAGPLVGAALLFTTDASFNWINLIAGLVYVLAMPFVAVATTYLYYDLKTRLAIEARELAHGDELPAEL